MEKLGIYLKQLREARNLSQEYVAGKLNVSPTTISRMEAQPEKFSVKRLKTYLCFFGKNFDDYFHFKQPANDATVTSCPRQSYLLLELNIQMDLTAAARNKLTNIIHLK